LFSLNLGSNGKLLDFDIVGEDKLAVMFEASICIYSLINGSNLMSKQQYNLRRLLYVENIYVIVYFTDNFTFNAYGRGKHKLIVIHLNDLKCGEMNIDDRVTSCAYLENGTLILGGEKPSALKADRWPFERITHDKFIKDQAELYDFEKQIEAFNAAALESKISESNVLEEVEIVRHSENDGVRYSNL
jgi:hypothetical protein